DILGIRLETDTTQADTTTLQPYEQAVDLLLSIRKEAKTRKDWATSDHIRDALTAIGFNIKDTKDGGWEWSLR
ncbi:MAG: cysteine--tRNA ligase, partial [Muribaculaceae bacterium]|nr:cysteine--tRNA ligase [Muribaculaceae bacterium]